MSIRVSPTVVVTGPQTTLNTNHITSSGVAHSAVKDATVKSVHNGVNLVTGALNEISAALTGDAAKKFKPSKVVVTCASADSPAYLVCDTPTAFGVTWTGVADGEFQADIDGSGLTSVTTCDFGTCADEDDVATVVTARLAVAFAALAPYLPTCSWVTDHYEIHSTNPTTTSAVPVLAAGLAGTDISGAGATDFLSGDVGHGVVHALPAAAAGRITIGTTSGGTDLLSAAAMTALQLPGQAFEIALSGLFPDIAGNATLYVKSTVGDGTALTYLVNVEVHGTQS